MVDVQPGQVYVPGITAKTARALLDSAKAAGLDPKLAVRTTEGGFVVPERIAPRGKKTARILPVDPPPEPDPSAAAPRGRRKKNPEKGS